MTLDMPDDFALDQPLSPFLLAALELLDPESDTYALDVISMPRPRSKTPSRCCVPRSVRPETRRWPI